MHRWDEPSLREKEMFMGYEPDATKSAHVTIQQRAQRLGQAMDGNTMRWLGAYLYATQTCISANPSRPVGNKKDFRKFGHEIPLILSHDEVHHHQACAVVEQIMERNIMHIQTLTHNWGRVTNSEKEKSTVSINRKLSKNQCRTRISNQFPSGNWDPN